MSNLVNQVCEACRAGAPTVSPEQLQKFKPQIPDWELIEIDNIKRLQRHFSFRDFREALDFSNRVGELAESEQHHPAILVEWGSVTVTWWTHKIRGLHVNDFILAAKTDTLAG